MEENIRIKSILAILENREYSVLKIQSFLAEQGLGKISKATLLRDLSFLINKNYIEKSGFGKATVYRLTKSYQLIYEINPIIYEKKSEQLTDSIFYNYEIFESLEKIILFDTNIYEHIFFPALEKYRINVDNLSVNALKKEQERLTTELSWKSAQIEGNTYSILETDTLFKESIQAIGKKKEEAIMLLNHKYAIEFIYNNLEIFKNLNIAVIEEIHKILVKDLNIGDGLRNRIVGITGTRYKPLDNKAEIQNQLNHLCDFINSVNGIFEKAFYTIILISYIQPFEDGNKRVARMISNAILASNNCFMIPFRSLGVNEFKRAMLVFYELNNISSFKKLFVQQVQYTSENYFNS